MRLRLVPAALALALAAGCATPPPAKPPGVFRDGDAIVFRGRIDEASAARFVALLQEGGVRRLVIDSPGGLVLPALQVATAVHERGIDVEVPSTCRSSCANYVFPAGRRKFAGRPGAVAWHGNMHHVLHLERTGQASWSEALMEGARELVRREKIFYASLGVDGFVCWFGKLPPYGVPDFYSLRAEDMARFGIRDVTIAGAPPDPEVSMLEVDWARLDALRPAD